MQAIKPSYNYEITPDSLGLSYQQNDVKYNDSIIIHSWLIKPLIKNELNSKLILISYGDAGNMSNFLELAYLLAEKGYSVAMYDYKGFGKSSAFAYNSKFLFHDEYIDDLKAVFQFYQKDFSTIYGYGLSMGGIIISKSNLNFKKIVLESTPNNLPLLIERLEKKKGKQILLPSNDKLEMVLSNTSIKTLILCGKMDELCLCKDYKQGKNIQMIQYNGNHMQAIYTMSSNNQNIGDKFIKAVYNFFNH